MSNFGFANNIEREIFYQRMARWARVLNPVGWIVGLSALLAPIALSPDAVRLLLAAACFAAMSAVALCIWSAGVLRLDAKIMYKDEASQKDKRPSIAGLFVVPAFAACMRALDIDHTDVSPLLAALLGGVGLSMIVAFADPVLAHREWGLVGITTVLVFCVYATLTAANAVLDQTEPTMHSAVITGKRDTGGKGRTYYLKLAPPLDHRFGDEVQVTGRMFVATNVGDRVCISERPGTLGFAWFEVASCGK